MSSRRRSSSATVYANEKCISSTGTPRPVPILCLCARPAGFRRCQQRGRLVRGTGTCLVSPAHRERHHRDERGGAARREDEAHRRRHRHLLKSARGAWAVAKKRDVHQTTHLRVVDAGFAHLRPRFRDRPG